MRIVAEDLKTKRKKRGGPVKDIIQVEVRSVLPTGRHICHTTTAFLLAQQSTLKDVKFYNNRSIAPRRVYLYFSLNGSPIFLTTDFASQGISNKIFSYG